MKKYSKQFSIEKMAKLFKVSRSGYYAFLVRKESKRSVRNQQLVEQIKTIHQESRKAYGSPRIHAELKARGENCSRKRIAKLMRKENISAKIRKKRVVTTVHSKTCRRIAPNILNQRFNVDFPDKYWASDITYVSTLEGWLYVSVVMDLFSRKIVGLSMGKSLHTDLVIKAFLQALFRRCPGKGLLHHSDRGSQYTSDNFQGLASKYGVELSMSAKGYCYDNAVVESFFHTLKGELVDCSHYRSREEASQSIFEYIEVFYNRQRRHSTLGYLSPKDFEEKFMKERRVQIPAV